MKNIEHALTSIRDGLDLPGLEFNQEGNAEIIFNEVFSGFISRVDDTHLEISFFIPGLDVNDNAVLYAMLEANCLGTGTGAGRLGIDASRARAVYCERWDIKHMNADTVDTRLREVVKFAGFWLTEGTGILQEEAAKKDQDKNANSLPTTGESDFMMRI